MPEYRRAHMPGGTFFFTVVTANRVPLLFEATAIRLLREAFSQTQRLFPFTVDALVVLPDHIHAIWTLPAGDTDFSRRWGFLKKTFTKNWIGGGGREQSVTASEKLDRRHGVWQRRFWEHTIRDDRDMERHCDYIYYNPVRHGLVACPHAWAHSTFERAVDDGFYSRDWLCVCNRVLLTAPDFDDIATTAME